MNNPDEIDIDIDDENDNDADIEEGTTIHLQVALKFNLMQTYTSYLLCLSPTTVGLDLLLHRIFINVF